MPLSPLFRPVAFADLPGWADDDHLAAFEAFRRSAFHVLTKPYRTGALGVDVRQLSPRPMRMRARHRRRATARGARASSSGISCRPAFRRESRRARLRHRLLRTGGRGFAGQDGTIHRAAAVAAGRSGRHRRRQPAGRHGSLSRLRRGRTETGPGRVFRPAGDRAGRAGRTRAGDRLAGRARSTPSSSMCRARRGSR